MVGCMSDGYALDCCMSIHVCVWCVGVHEVPTFIRKIQTSYGSGKLATFHHRQLQVVIVEQYRHAINRTK